MQHFLETKIFFQIAPPFSVQNKSFISVIQLMSAQEKNATGHSWKLFLLS